MPGRLAVDFGTSNTVLSLWDADRKEAIPLSVPEFTHTYAQNGQAIPVVPSLIHFAPGRQRWIGEQVLQRNLYDSGRTFRWMKRYISNRSPLRTQIDGLNITPAQAGQEFLTSLLLFTVQDLELGDEEVAFSVPVEAFEHYESWLAGVAAAAGMPRFRLIDEPSAAALGYGAHVLPGNVYLIFDFGGGTLHAAVIRVEDDTAGSVGRRCRVLGKSGRDIGGSTIDQWIYQDVLQRSHRQDIDDDIRPVSNRLLVACEAAKETLSSGDQALIAVVNPISGSQISAEYTRSAFEELLDGHGLFSEIDRTVRAAINAARERGFAEDSIQAAIMVGGSSQIPAVQRTLRQIFGRERVLFDRPLDAVARGASAFVAGVDFYDHIQHDYAIRYVEPEASVYNYRVVVPRGTPYPTRDPVARLTVKATFDGQSQLGIAIFELGEQRRITPGNGHSMEIVFDPGGNARVMPVTPDEQERRTHFWMNEQAPTFLSAEPPAARGEARFTVDFQIDGNKRLLMTARDMQTGRLAYQDYPVVQLT